MRFFQLFLAISLIYNMDLIAGHPLRGEDTGLIGARRLQIELLGDYYKNSPGHSGLISTAFTLGLNNRSDFILTLPYHYSRNEDTAHGIGDIVIEYKYLLMQNENFNIAVKPILSFGSSNYEKGFGTGKNNYGLNLILTYISESFSIHTNLTGSTNYNYCDEKEGSWNFSIGGELFLSEKINLLSELGISNCLNRDKMSNPIFGLIGLSYNLYENINLSAGVGKDFHDRNSQTNFTIGVGILF